MVKLVSSSFGPEGKYSHHRWELIPLLHHFNAVESDLGGAGKEFYMLAVHLWELAPDHAIFEEPAFDLVSFSSWKSQKMHGLYKETRNNSIRP